MAADKNGKQLPPGIRYRGRGSMYEGRLMFEYKNYSVYDTTITGVKKKMTDLRYKLEHGDFIAIAKVTLDDWFKSWIEQYKENQVKIGTVISYQNYYNSILKISWEKRNWLISGGSISKMA